MRLAARSAAHDCHGTGARHARDGGVYDRNVPGDHGRRSLHAPGRRRRPGRCGADRQRPLRRRHDRRRADSPAHRTGAGRAAAGMTGPAPGTPGLRPGSERPLTPRASAGIAARYAAVVLPIPVPRTYTYLIPPELESRVVPGARVVVPVQRRQVMGVVAAVDRAPPAPTVAVKPIAAAPDAAPAITAPLLALGVWMRDRKSGV